MNEEMQLAWLEISDMLGEPTREELDVFLRTWQRASQATREALAEQPAQRKPLPYNKEDMKDLDVNQRLAFKLGWKSAEEAHGIKENT